MSDLNTPDGRERPEAPANGPDEAAPDEDAALHDIEPPPPVDPDLPGVPDTSIALGEIDPDEPGANATGVGDSASIPRLTAEHGLSFGRDAG